MFYFYFYTNLNTQLSNSKIEKKNIKSKNLVLNIHKRLVPCACLVGAKTIMTVAKAVISSSLSNSSSSSNTNITYQWGGQRCWGPISLPIPKPNSQNLTITTRNRSLLIPRASGAPPESNNGGSSSNKTKTKNKTIDPPPSASSSGNEKIDASNKIQEEQEQKQKQQRRLDLVDVNPVGLGRRSRQLFDEVWRKFSGLGQISRTSRADERDALDALLIREGPMCEFVIPGAQNTTVLVVGATSSIGRIVVRKLMLRGYTVKVFISIQVLRFLMLCFFCSFGFWVCGFVGFVVCNRVGFVMVS